MEGSCLTYLSLTARAYAHDTSEEALQLPSTPSTRIWSPSTYSRDHGPGLLQPWAEARGLQVYWVDNCWMRVPVTEAELRSFISEVVGETLTSEAPADTRLMLEADEF